MPYKRREDILLPVVAALDVTGKWQPRSSSGLLGKRVDFGELQNGRISMTMPARQFRELEETR